MTRARRWPITASTASRPPWCSRPLPGCSRSSRATQHRDAELWCREIQVEACYRLLLLLCGLNGRYFTRFQVKRLHLLESKLAHAPPALADRIEALLGAPPREAFALLHALEGEVLDRVAAQLPDIDLAPARQRRAAYAGA